ncbi:MAG: PQQ-binding-like beta-propeller repeat protein [Verrucomicrobia bacterium]|nr:PQQ-binding-like beta-propeller repeat protein [Verrucomicrobiota bacterium]
MNMNVHPLLLAGIALAAACLPGGNAAARDWPQWCGSDGKNMVAEEKGLPESFAPGEKDPQGGGVQMETTRNVKWVIKSGRHTCGTPVISRGKVFVGCLDGEDGVLRCLDEKTGRELWQWRAPLREKIKIDGWKWEISINFIPKSLGVCSSPAVDGDRLYFVTHRFEVICLDVNGKRGAEAGQARVLWTYDLWKELQVLPSDAANGSPVVDGDFLYVSTSNGVDRAPNEPNQENHKTPFPQAPNVIVLDKKTGRLLARDEAPIAAHMLHGQWSSVSLGNVNGRKLVFFGGGDGVCYAFEALTAKPPAPVKLKTVWWYDCVPPEYKEFGGLDWANHYFLGDKRNKKAFNKSNDGTFAGESEIIATPVFLNNRVYIPIGRDPEHGRGRGALHCIDATQTGDITKSGRIWCYQGLDRSLATVSIADGLLYVGDVAGRLHCLDVATGQCHWVHDGHARTFSSTLVTDGKIYYPTEKNLWVLAAGKELKVLNKMNLGAPIWTSPVAANGTLYISSKNYLWAVQNLAKP